MDFKAILGHGGRGRLLDKGLLLEEASNTNLTPKGGVYFREGVYEIIQGTITASSYGALGKFGEHSRRLNWS